jgi:hypothetical protein
MEQKKARVYDILVEIAKLQKEQAQLEQEIANAKEEVKPVE